MESIGPWYCLPFPTAKLEEEFWQQHRDSDLARARIFLIAAAVALLVFATTDYRLFDLSNTFAWLSIARGLGILATGIALWRIHKQPTCRNVRFILLLWSLGAAVVVVAISATRPSDYLGYSVVNLTFLFAGYLLLPSTWVFLAAPGALASLLFIILALRAAPEHGLAHLALITSFIAANVLGCAWAHQLEYWKRKQFLALRAETELRLRLQKALAEIKTLHGIVPICSYCKRIRDEAGTWFEVDVYVGTHTNAEFSHGICPICMHAHYQSYLEQAQAPPQDPAA